MLGTAVRLGVEFSVTARQDELIRAAIEAIDHRAAPVLTWVALSAVFALFAVAVAGVFAARQLAERQAVNGAGKTADLIAEAVGLKCGADLVPQKSPRSV